MSKYSPGVLSAEQRARRFVGRHDLLDRLVDGVVGAVRDGGARYDLVVGPRGSGKTHLLTLLADRLATEPSLAGVHLVVLSEEEHVASFTSLLARILGALDASSIATLRAAPHTEAGDVAQRMLLARVGDATLILILENLDRVFQAIGVGGQRKLRALLNNHGRIQIVAGSQTAGAAFHNRDQPFYRHFVQHTLDALNPEACQEMLARLAEEGRQPELALAVRSASGLARVRAVHAFSGGLARTMALLYPHLDLETFDAVEDAFAKVADELTPYFQEQARNRSPGQQAILEVLAESWTPRSVKELAQATFTSEQSTSGQLRHLRRDGIVHSHRVGRESFYVIADPLWRVARSMKRPDRVPQTLLRFVRHLFEPMKVDAWLPLLDPDGALVAELDAESMQGEFVTASLRELLARAEAGKAAECRELARAAYERQPGALTAAAWLAVDDRVEGAELLRLHGVAAAGLASLFATLLNRAGPLLPELHEALRADGSADALLTLTLLGGARPSEAAQVAADCAPELQIHVLVGAARSPPAVRLAAIRAVKPHSEHVEAARAVSLYDMGRFAEAFRAAAEVGPAACQEHPVFLHVSGFEPETDALVHLRATLDLELPPAELPVIHAAYWFARRMERDGEAALHALTSPVARAADGTTKTAFAMAFLDYADATGLALDASARQIGALEALRTARAARGDVPRDEPAKPHL